MSHRQCLVDSLTDPTEEAGPFLLSNRLPQAAPVEALDDEGLAAIQANFERLFNMGLQAQVYEAPEEAEATTVDHELEDYDLVGFATRTTTLRGWGTTLDATTVGTAAASPRAEGHFVSLTTAALAGSDVRSYGGAPVFRTIHGPEFHMILCTGASLSNMRLFIGFWNIAPANTDDPFAAAGANQPAIIIKYDPVNGDTGWIGLTRDNGTSNSVTSVVGSVAVSTVYHIKIRITTTGAYFSVNGGTEVLGSSTYPLSTSNLNSFGFYLYTTDGNTKTVEISRYFVKFGTKGY